MSNKSVAIIGAGIAGLSAGCYLQMNGYDTVIYELHKVPGGLCTGWKRKDYVIDNCIHWLVGSSPGDNFYYLWNELIDMKKLEFVEHEEFIRVEDKGGNFIRVFTDIDKLEKEMLEKAPEDSELILEFVNAAKRFLKLYMPVDKAPEIYGLWDILKMMRWYIPYRGALNKWVSISAEEYAGRFNNPLLKKTFEHMFLPKMSVLFLLFTLVWMHRKSGGYPVGGSLEFARLIEKRYLELGGKISYKSRVTKIITDNDKATGIMLENGEIRNSDMVISAADGHFTIFEMLEGKYINAKIKDYYDNYEIFPSYVMVSLGIAGTFDDVPNTIVFPLEKPLVVDESVSQEDIMVRIFNFDPTLAPAGKTVITATLATENYLYWDNLRNDDIERYRSEKERIANEVIEILDRRFGNIKSNVEMVDVSTPSTVIRYTNNWKGSFEGWLITPKMGFSRIPKVLPGLKNFYMAGQWVEPGGGLPAVLSSGRGVTQIICKKDKKKFTSKTY